MVKQVPPLTAEQTRQLRIEGGRWLKGLREARGLSQRQLHVLVAPNSPRTVISGIEIGRVSISTEHYEIWSNVLEFPLREFVLQIMFYYDPVMWRILVDSDGRLLPKVAAPADLLHVI